MKRKVKIATSAAVALTGLALGLSYFFADPDENLLGEYGDRNEKRTGVWFEAEVVNSASPTIQSDFEIDINRLYDLSYETDPRLVAFARKVNKTPGCVIEIVRLRVEESDEFPTRCDASSEGGAAESVLLPGTYEDVCRFVNGTEVCRRIKVADHPYEQYSDEELRSLAVSSPEASVILARRSDDDATAERYYERAVALSGKAGPLEEWMLHRNVGGLVRIGGELDIERASLGYEIYLTTSQLGYGSDSLSHYEQMLSEAGVQLEPIRAKANARFQRLTETRREMLAAGWEG